MPKGFFQNHEATTYMWVMVISVWAGFVSYFSTPRKVSVRSFVIHIVSAAFAGFITFLFCDYMNIDGPIVGMLCGVAAHMGTPAIIQAITRSSVVKNILRLDQEKRDDNRS